jgi:hypothetical protein
MSSSWTYPARRSPAQLSKDYPLLYELSINRRLEILPEYTKLDLMRLFDCCEKTIRRWTVSGSLPNRRLPKRGRCLPGDLEEFLSRTEPNTLEEISNA